MAAHAGRRGGAPRERRIVIDRIDRLAPRSEGVLVIVSLDTEEDNWYRSPYDVTVENIGELRRLAAFFDRLGVRPTYFTAYQVATDPRAADVMREVSDGGRAEIAAHLHPWNTPPVAEAFVPGNSMLNNLPLELQVAKLRRLTAALEETFDQTPRAFRAGRYGLGSDTVAHGLVEQNPRKSVEKFAEYNLGPLIREILKLVRAYERKRSEGTREKGN